MKNKFLLNIVFLDILLFTAKFLWDALLLFDLYVPGEVLVLQLQAQ